MRNLQNNIWNQRLPSFLGLFILGISLLTITWLSRNVILFGTKAATANIPRSVQITNITDTSFTVSYFTDEKVLGSLSYGKDPKVENAAFDDRDQQTGTAEPHRMHSITVKNITSATKYYFTIASGDTEFSDQNAPYEVTTAPAHTDEKPTQQPLTGLVALTDGSVPMEALVYVSSNNSQILSAPVKIDGTYEIPLDSLLTKDLSSRFPITPATTLQLVVADPTLKSTVSFLADKSYQVPLVILSKDYDFSAGGGTNIASPSAVASGSAIPAFPTLAETPTSNDPQILTPRKEQTFKDPQPVFRGKAPPNVDVEITIQSDQEITTTIKTDDNGNWEYRPGVPLAPGEHSITIKAVDPAGIVQTVTQSFVVFAEGGQFTEPSVAPSVTDTPSPTTAPAATPTTVTTPTSGPTGTPVPKPSISPSLAISPVVTNAPLPASGSSSILFSILGMISAVGIGTLLFFFTAL